MINKKKIYRKIRKSILSKTDICVTILDFSYFVVVVILIVIKKIIWNFQFHPSKVPIKIQISTRNPSILKIDVMLYTLNAVYHINKKHT